jgi:hypothetical protein
VSANPVTPKRQADAAAPEAARRRRGARFAGAFAYPLMYFGVVAGLLPLLSLILITAPIVFGVLFGAGETEFVAGFSRAFAFVLLFLATPFAVWIWAYVGVGVVAFVGGILLSVRILRRHGVGRPGAVTNWGFWATLPIQFLFGFMGVVIVFASISAGVAADADGVATIRAFGQGMMIATVANLLISAGLGALLFPAVLRAVPATKRSRRPRA